MRHGALVLGLVAGLLAAPAAQADPVALRHPDLTRTAVVEGGWPEASVAWWNERGRGLAVDWRLPAAAVGLAAGRHRQLAGGDRVGLDLYTAWGVRIPTLDPGLVVTGTTALYVGRRGPGVLVDGGLAVPAELRVGGWNLHAPVLLEGRLGHAVGPVELGLRVAAGVVLNAPGTATFTGRWALWVRLPG